MSIKKLVASAVLNTLQLRPTSNIKLKTSKSFGCNRWPDKRGDEYPFGIFFEFTSTLDGKQYNVSAHLTQGSRTIYDDYLYYYYVKVRDISDYSSDPRCFNVSCPR